MVFGHGFMVVGHCLLVFGQDFMVVGHSLLVFGLGITVFGFLVFDIHHFVLLLMIFVYVTHKTHDTGNCGLPPSKNN